MKGFMYGKLKRSKRRNRLDPLRPIYATAEAPTTEFSGGRWSERTYYKPSKPRARPEDPAAPTNTTAPLL